MSVMECARNRCENIMCDFYSPIYGYLCSDCRSELLQKPHEPISVFMMSEKGRPDSLEEWHEYVADEFTDQSEVTA